jgi:hypothetical protein
MHTHHLTQPSLWVDWYRINLQWRNDELWSTVLLSFMRACDGGFCLSNVFYIHE